MAECDFENVKDFDSFRVTWRKCGMIIAIGIELKSAEELSVGYSDLIDEE